VAESTVELLMVEVLTIFIALVLGAAGNALYDVCWYGFEKAAGIWHGFEKKAQTHLARDKFRSQSIF
jgi:hypothetical protein